MEKKNKTKIKVIQTAYYCEWVAFNRLQSNALCILCLQNKRKQKKTLPANNTPKANKQKPNAICDESET